MTSCLVCGNLLLWGDDIRENSQDCYCMFCNKKYVAIFEKNRIEE